MQLKRRKMLGGMLAASALAVVGGTRGQGGTAVPSGYPDESADFNGSMTSRQRRRI